MNPIKKAYAKLLAAIKREVDKAVQKHLTILSLSLNKHKGRIISDNNIRKPRVIVSLTTFSKRIDSVHLVIESIARQSIKPDEIILVLDEEEFNNEYLPQYIKDQINRGLKIRYTHNTKSYKKLIPTIFEYPEDLVITIDDDLIYPTTLIEKLLYYHKLYPEAIICHQGREIKFFKDGKITTYTEWPYVTSEMKPSKHIIAVGYGGVLYPPNSLKKEMLDERLFTRFAPNADDLWFKAASVLNNTKVMCTGFLGENESDFIHLDSRMIDSLSSENVIGKKNDIQMQSIADEYPNFIPSIKENNKVISD